MKLLQCFGNDLDHPTDPDPVYDRVLPGESDLVHAQLIIRRLRHHPLIGHDRSLRADVDKALSLMESAHNEYRRRRGIEVHQVQAEPEPTDRDIADWLNSEYLSKAVPLADHDHGQRRRPIEVWRSRALQVVAASAMSRNLKKNNAVQAALLYKVCVLREVKAFPILQLVLSWKSFNVFDLDVSTDGSSLLILVMHIVYSSGMANELSMNIGQFALFIQEIQRGYLPVPFHNHIHAADVVSAVYAFIKPMYDDHILSSLDLLAAIVAAACHDFRHPGTNNALEIMTGSQLALIYNDRAVLEQYHISEAIAVLKQPQFNMCLGRLHPDQRLYFKNLIINMVLGTDMSNHVHAIKSLDLLASQLAPLDAVAVREKLIADKEIILRSALHVADLSNPTRPLPTYRRWTGLLMQEFFAQGDIEREKNLPISPMMNREVTNVAKAQVGFISFVVRPLFALWVEIVPHAQECLNQMDENKEFWANNNGTVP